MLKRVWFVLLCVFAVSWASGVQAQWRVAESEHFIVYAEQSERELRNTVGRLERLHSLMETQFGNNADAPYRKLPIYSVGSERELKTMFPTIGSNVGGYYSANGNNIYAAFRRGMGEHVLYHEYAHHFLYNTSGVRFPSWFNEGFAEFFGASDVDTPNKVKIGYAQPHRLATLNNQRWLPMLNLLSAANRQYSGQERAMFYAQSWLLTHYLITDAQRRAGLDRYLAAVSGGMSETEALQTHLGMTPDELTAALRAYLRGRMPYAEMSVPDNDALIQIRELPPSAKDMLLYSVALQYNQPEETLTTLMSRVRADASRYPDDRLAMVTLGRAELRWGDKAVAEQTLKRALELHPSDTDALRLMADLHIERAEPLEGDAKVAEIREAQNYLRRALEADPTDYRIYMTLARLRSGSPSYPTENDIATLTMALTYAPQVTPVRVQLANALRAAGRQEEAERILSVANASPHIPQ